MMQISDKITALQSTELFKGLSEEALTSIAEKIIEKKIPHKKVIFQEGEEGDGMYIIVSGEVDILKKKQKIAELNAGDFFGELALIEKAPRAATAMTVKDCVLLFLDKASFDEILKSMPIVLEASMRKIMSYLRTYTNV